MTGTPTGATERAELAALLQLCTLPHVGPARLRALLGTRGAKAALMDLHTGRAATLAALGARRGVNSELIESWRRHVTVAVDRAGGQSDVIGADLLEAHERAGVWLHLPSRDDAAELWATDPEPPAVLFGKGAPIDFSVRRVGIVGTRRCSAYGRGVAKLLGAGLAADGVAVVSGLATGIDGIAQRAALDAGGLVIGVVGSGLDCVYPPANRELWADIAQEGTLLSEYPLGTGANRWQFPARNRIVAALCEVLVVVESGPTGGSMYTVDAAVERGRPVMAVPGPITSVASAGTNRLLADGCAPVCEVADILLALGVTSRVIGRAATHEPTEPLDRQVLDELTAGPATVDGLALRFEASIAELASSLSRLQLSNWVTETGGWWEKSR